MADIWDKANDATDADFQYEYWGEVSMDVWECALVKGQGRVPFDPAIHKKGPYAAINLNLYPLGEMDLTFNVERNLVHFEREWTEFTKPSAIEALEAAGFKPHIRELSDKFVHATQVPSGETYARTKDDGTEEVVTKKALKILRVFKDEGACRAHYLAGAAGDPGAMSKIEQEDEAIPGFNESDALMPFLEVVVKSAAGKHSDLIKIREDISNQIAAIPQLAGKFTVDSPEVVQMLAQAV